MLPEKLFLTEFQTDKANFLILAQIDNGVVDFLDRRLGLPPEAIEAFLGGQDLHIDFAEDSREIRTITIVGGKEVLSLDSSSRVIEINR